LKRIARKKRHGVNSLFGHASNYRYYALRVVGLFALTLTSVGAFASCTQPQNAIEAENCLTGTDSSQWSLGGSAPDPTLEGFTTDISYNVGQTVSFKISTSASSYHIEIYRMGYYQGNGARLITTFTPSASLAQNQPACLTDSTTGLADCGNWRVFTLRTWFETIQEVTAK
jgi:N,N-dimethylformamidase beta subunit-like protein